MPPGKLAAQAGHAYLDSFLIAQTRDPARTCAYVAPGHGTKVALAAPSLNALLRAADEATAEGIPHALITDSGHVLLPHFDGSPVVTALGLGPATREEVERITRRFHLI